MEENDRADMFARQWWVWYLGDIQQQSDQELLSRRARRTPNSHQIVTQSCCHPFIAFWLLAWFFFFFFFPTKSSFASCPCAETGTSLRAFTRRRFGMRELLCRRGIIPLFTFLTVKDPLRWRFVSAALVFDSSTTGQRKGVSTGGPND